MSVTVDDYRYKLLKDIAGSASDQEIKQLIDRTMAGLGESQVSAMEISRFLDIMVHDLGNRDLADASKKQSNNIRIARIYLNEIKLNRKFS